MSNDRLIKVITDSKVEQPTALMLQNSFLPFYEKITEWSEKAKTLVVTDAAQTREMKMAREARLALKDIRVQADKTRKALKEDSTRYGKAVQSVYNLIEELIVPAEKHLEAQEKFVELQEAARKLELAKTREIELEPYKEFVTSEIINELGEYTAQEFVAILDRCKKDLEDQIAEEAQAELDRIEAEKVKVDRQGKMFELGFKWDGREFSYKSIRFGFGIMDMPTESFEGVYQQAKSRKEQLDIEDKQTLAETTERKDQSPLVEHKVIWSYPNPVIPLPKRVVTPNATPAANTHPSHCFYCGAMLSEIGLGGLECDDCLTVFIPFLDESGNQCLASQK